MLVLLTSLVLAPLHGEPWPPPPPRRASTVKTISLFLMERDVDDAEPANEQTGLAVEFDMYRLGSGAGWELGLSYSSEEDSGNTALDNGELEVTVSEVYFGVRKTWGQKLHLYLAGGSSFVLAEADVSGVGSEDDTSFGFYARGGAYWTFGQHINLGADIKTLMGTDIDFGDADYLQLGLGLGYSF